MTITHSYRISARVTQQIADARTIAGVSTSTSVLEEKMKSAIADKCKGLLITYIVKVQIRVMGVWVTTWRECCDASDDLEREHLLLNANKLFETMEATL